MILIKKTVHEIVLWDFFLNVNSDTKFIRALLFCRMGQVLADKGSAVSGPVTV